MNSPVYSAAAPMASDAAEASTPQASLDPFRACSAITPAGVTPEILRVIEAAATSFLGRKVRVLSVKLASESEVHTSSWASQGRDMIHGSHNLVQRGR